VLVRASDNQTGIVGCPLGKDEGSLFFYLSGSLALAVILEVVLLAEALGLDWFATITVHHSLSLRSSQIAILDCPDLDSGVLL
jgi:hypothetical protein